MRKNHNDEFINCKNDICRFYRCSAAIKFLVSEMDRSKILLVFISALAFLATGATVAQITTSDELHDTLQSNLIRNFHDYANTNFTGIYYFGFSEGESNIIVLAYNSGLCVQYRDGFWQKDSLGEHWRTRYTNLKNVRLQGDHFIATGWTGKFLIYKSDTGLVIFKSRNSLIENNTFGQRSNNYKLLIRGKYPDASWRMLQDQDLKDMTLSQLRIMRNEIYARYGYKFPHNPEMRRYFGPQQWYNPSYDNVESSLTEIEKINIALIKKHEKKFNGG